MKISSILARKGSTVWKVAPDCSVRDAVRKLGEHRVSALVVERRDGTLVGIVTEHDILADCGCECCRSDRHAHPIAAACPRQVQDILTTELVTGTPEHELEHAMELMARHDLRYLPIVDGGELVGIVSVGDLVHAYLNQAALESRELGSYVGARAF